MVAPNDAALAALSPEEKAAAFEKMSPEKKAAKMEKSSPEEKAALLSAMDPEEKAAGFQKMSPEEKATMMEKSSPEEKAAAFENMSPEEKATMMEKSSPEEKAAALETMDPEEKAALAGFEKMSPEEKAVVIENGSAGFILQSDDSAKLIRELQQEIQEYQNELNIQMFAHEVDVQQLEATLDAAKLEVSVLETQMRDMDDQVQMAGAQIIDLQERHEVELAAMEEVIRKLQAENDELQQRCGRGTGKPSAPEAKGGRKQHVETKQVIEEKLEEEEIIQDLMQSIIVNVAEETTLQTSAVSQATGVQVRTVNVQMAIKEGVSLGPAASGGTLAAGSTSSTVLLATNSIAAVPTGPGAQATDSPDGPFQVPAGASTAQAATTTTAVTGTAGTVVAPTAPQTNSQGRPNKSPTTTQQESVSASSGAPHLGSATPNSSISGVDTETIIIRTPKFTTMSRADADHLDFVPVGTRLFEKIKSQCESSSVQLAFGAMRKNHITDVFKKQAAFKVMTTVMKRWKQQELLQCVRGWAKELAWDKWITLRFRAGSKVIEAIKKRLNQTAMKGYIMELSAAVVLDKTCVEKDAVISEKDTQVLDVVLFMLYYVVRKHIRSCRGYYDELYYVLGTGRVEDEGGCEDR